MDEALFALEYLKPIKYLKSFFPKETLLGTTILQYLC